MKNTKIKASHFSFFKLINPHSLILFVSFNILTTACATTHAKQEQAHAVLTEQAKALQALKRERAAPEIAGKIGADPTLSAAEARLRVVLDLLEGSNEAVQKSF